MGEMTCKCMDSKGPAKKGAAAREREERKAGGDYPRKRQKWRRRRGPSGRGGRDMKGAVENCNDHPLQGRHSSGAAYMLFDALYYY